MGGVRRVWGQGGWGAVCERVRGVCGQGGEGEG